MEQKIIFFHRYVILGLLCCLARFGSLLGVLLMQYRVFHGAAAAAGAGAAFLLAGVAVVLLPEVGLAGEMPTKTRNNRVRNNL